MTETLTRVLHDRADVVRFDAVDVDAVTRAGSRAIRHRRLTVVAGAAACALAVAALAVVPWPDDRQAGPATDDGTAGVTWASGTVLHTPSGDVDLGHDVAAYVRTAVGYVATDGHEVYSVTGDEVQTVGSIHNATPMPGWPRMVSDPLGSLAAWPDGSDFVVLDQQTGELQRVFSTPYPYLVGVEGRKLYATDQRDSFAIDADNGEVQPVSDLNANDLSLVDARAGALLAIDGEGRLVTGPEGREALLPTAPDAASLSPDGHWAVAGYSQASGPVQSFDLRTGARTALPLDAFTAYPYQWLDDDTLVLLSLPSASAHYQLVTCVVSTPVCEVAVPDLGEGRDEGGNGVEFVLPIGEPYFPYPHG